MSLENFGEPVTFVRSPMLTKFVSGRIVSGSRPLKRVNDSTFLRTRGGKPLTASASTLICGGVVPQQPPTKFNHPFSAQFFNCGASDSGVSGNPVGKSGFGKPAFGCELK